MPTAAQRNGDFSGDSVVVIGHGDGLGRLDDEQRRLLQRLTEVETLEKFLHKAYLGQKRFSIEGIPVVSCALE